MYTTVRRQEQGGPVVNNETTTKARANVRTASPCIAPLSTLTGLSKAAKAVAAVDEPGISARVNCL